MDALFLSSVGVGFAAQIIDGTLGMAYGVTSTTFLLGIGVPPAAASACVHTSEIFTTALSGFFHLRFGNVDRKIFLKLLIPGIIGGVTGAYLLSNFPGDAVKPYTAAYMLLMGLFILRRAYKNITEARRQVPLVPLGLAGGFFDAIGGGGWGPIVTSTLVAQGSSPRNAVGSVNLAEFFVTVCESITFILFLGISHVNIIGGLLLGGVLAAPLAAWTCKKMPHRPFLWMVGFLIIILSLRTMFKIFF
ncbi:MAG TPA: sulfite exporter TauE/SafE family protein [Elusimicrobiota bacterium]|nr:sulfite exporter TauE/SafE family protein [Elusimicrobiota bacterium]